MLSRLGKLFTSLINSRLYDYLTEAALLGKEQVGFRKDYSTLDHIFALHILSRFHVSHKRKLFSALIDYSKTFDFVYWSLLWTKLLHTNISGKIKKVLQVSRCLYNNVKSCVKVVNVDLSYFPCNVVVRQGDDVSPLLFSIYLNDFKEYINKESSGIPFISENVIIFSDIAMFIIC